MSAVAWLLPMRATDKAGLYDALFAVAFLTRVFLLPMAGGFAVLGTIAAACRRCRIAAIGLLLATAWAAPELWASRAKGQPGQGPTFSIASFNLNKNLRSADGVIAQATAMDSDFVVFQELTPTIAASLETALADRYPHRIVLPDVGFDGTAVFSRTAIALIHAPSGGPSDRNLRVRAAALGQTFVLENVHLAPPRPADRRATNRRQVRQMIEAHADDAVTNQPSILIGDFNFTTFSPQGSALAAAGFVDAHRQAGRGRQVTWPAAGTGERVPPVRIDTAYTIGSAFVAVDTLVGHSYGSDHLPIKVTFRRTSL